MAEYTIEQFTKYKALSWYNSERRRVQGGVVKSYISPNNYVEMDFRQATVNEFRLDGTETDENNRKNVVLFTWANGVYVDCDYYIYSTPAGDHLQYNFRGNFKLHAKDGTLLLQTLDQALTSNDYAGSMLDNYILYVTIGSPTYQTQGDYAYNISGFYGVYLSPNGSVIGENPAGHTYNQNEFLRNNTVYSFGSVTAGNIQQSYDRIFGNGDDTPITPIMPSDDTSGEGGGESANPDYNPFSDSINFPDLPTGGSALASGFIKLYHPLSGELNQLAAKLWSDNFFEEIKKIQNDPLEAIVSLHSVPFGIVGASRQSCRIGNYDSEITMDTIGAQFYTVDCGNIAIPEHWASALDYAPYTDIEIYLPFCGVKPLQIDDVMNRVLNVKYNIDILTGAAICMVKCGDSVLYTYNTEIAQNIPISASNHAQLYQSIISAASAVVGVASGGAGAVVGAVQSAATVAASKHSQVSRGGSLGGSVGVLGDFVPYLIIHRPIQSLAADFAHKKGYPSNITAILSSVSGYTEVDSIHLENIPCTDMEREELYRILKEGVIL